MTSIWFSLKSCAVLGFMHQGRLEWQSDTIPRELSNDWNKIKAWNARAGFMGKRGRDI